MSFILGIDTGGTFTDAVIVEKVSKTIVAKSKVFTTHDNLTNGIADCIDMLGCELYSEVSEVHISTTLAVNAILERRFEKVGLLQLGKNLETEVVPANYVMTIKTPFFRQNKYHEADRIAQMGDIRKTFFGNVDYVVVTSSQNEEAIQQEYQIAKTIIQQTGVNAFCVREYCDAEDYTERTITAMLLLYLKPVIEQWLASTESMMKEKGIRAELKIVNAMGKLITCEEARRNPLATLCSGLAASVVGGLGMTTAEDFLLVDMGGTSTDITRIISRQFRQMKELSSIGHFLIAEKTMDVQTFGIGGDSHVKITQTGTVVAGPQRAIPICVMSSQYPYLTEELELCKRPQRYEMLTAQDVDCFIGVRGYRHSDLTEREREIVDYLVDAPHNVFVIAEHFHIDPDALHLDRLVKKGAVKLISVTPTDLLHAEGTFEKWNTSGAKAAIRHMAKQLGVSPEVCKAAIREAVVKKLIKACMQSIANFEKEQFDFNQSSGAAFLLERFYEKADSMLEMSFEINKPIVGLGAPAEVWLTEVGKRMNTEVMIPEHGEVANAFGAAIAE